MKSGSSCMFTCCDLCLLIGVRGCVRTYAHRWVADGEGSSGELSCDLVGSSLLDL